MKRVLVLGLLCLTPATGLQAGTQEGLEAFRSARYDVAVKELAPAAKAGDPDAQYLLGRLYTAGLGVERNHETAAELYRQGAEGGNFESAQEYGTALVAGTGVEQNFEEGLKWLYVAMQGGLPTAKVYLDQFIKIVPRQTVIKARMGARAWHNEFAAKKTKAAN